MTPKTQKRKLRKLANYLDKVTDDKFDMRNYFDDGKNTSPSEIVPKDVKIKYHNCGTVACALGHAPLIFPSFSGESWAEYTARVFDLRTFGLSWNYMFSAEWEEFDNTPSGAATRIRYWCRNGCPFEDPIFKKVLDQKGVH